MRLFEKACGSGCGKWTGIVWCKLRLWINGSECCLVSFHSSCLVLVCLCCLGYIINYYISVKNEHIVYIIKVVSYLQHHSTVVSAAFVCTFNATQVKISPIDKIAVLCETKGMREVVYYDLSLKACRRYDNIFTSTQEFFNFPLCHAPNIKQRPLSLKTCLQIRILF